MKHLLGYVAVMLATACAETGSPVGIDPSEGSPDGKADGVAALPDVRCAKPPEAGPAKKFRHSGSKVVAALGGAHHRGLDLVAAASSTQQVIAGEASYGLFDKSLRDEDIDVFACRAGAWTKLGTARTDDSGAFHLPLTGSARLPIGMRDMFMSVVGDRTSAGFLAIVADDAAQLAVSDVDGTLTTSEAAFAGTAFGIDPNIHEGAPAAWQAIAAKGLIPIYVTARARPYTDDTRTWLARKGMPRGALRLSPHTILPGSGTAEYKAATFADLETQLPIDLGIGNRATDIDAYEHAGVSPGRIFVKLSEFESELAEPLAAGRAIGFASYGELKID